MLKFEAICQLLAFKLPKQGINLDIEIGLLESNLLQQALSDCGNNRSKAAKKLTLTLKDFNKRMKYYNRDSVKH
jgi:DNA-binding NtrC family response regulator